MDKIRNIGPTTAGWLSEVGVSSITELERVGVVETYRRVRELRPGDVSLNLLWALQGALMDLHWSDVPDEIKQQLMEQLN